MFATMAIVLGAAVLRGSSVRASDDPAKQPVLHQPVPAITSDEVHAALARHGLAGAASAGQARLGEGPALTGGDSEAGHFTGQDKPGRRTSHFRPDRETGLSAPLPYTASFEPSVAPFKRLSAFDSVAVASDGRTLLLVVGQPDRAPVPVIARRTPEPGYTRFVGEAEVDFSQGPVVPLPTVAPEVVMRQLAALPPLPLEVQRDGADNYVLVLRGPSPKRPVRVSFEMDAPDAYFGAQVPATPLGRLTPLPVPLSRGMRRRGLRVASRIGVAPSSDLRTAVHRLTRHFRTFEESHEPPRDSGDLYADLALGKKGICRHRAYGFAVTALSLGIQTRFVQNEAHSFVEVKLPSTGYMRIDLGGAAGGLSTSGLENRTLHKPKKSDALPRPPSYEQSYAQAAMGIESAVEAGPLGVKAAVGKWLPPQKLSEMEVASGLNERAGVARARTGREPRGGRQHSRAPSFVTLLKVQAMVTRGETLAVSGRVQDGDGRGIAGLMIEVSLGDKERDERLLLGLGETGAAGTFSLEMNVPRDVAAADYALHVGTPGNDHYAPAEAP